MNSESVWKIKNVGKLTSKGFVTLLMLIRNFCLIQKLDLNM